MSDQTRPKEDQMKHLAMAITAAVMLGAFGSVGSADARLHQHQGIGPTTHHHGKHRH
jgi:hypothetical protein